MILNQSYQGNTIMWYNKKVFITIIIVLHLKEDFAENFKIELSKLDD